MSDSPPPLPPVPPVPPTPADTCDPLAGSGPRVDAPPFADPREIDAPGRLHSGLEMLKDNLEAFTVALIMALVIKHFCVEAFKIPTGSMYPTLYGENKSPQNIGDRILVDKWAYLLSGPERWDVVVFRYPLNWSKHFIKRVTGLGGEWIKAGWGDMWTRRSEEEPWRIATKRRRVRDELYLPVYPPERPDPDDPWSNGPAPEPTDYWEAEGGWSVEDYTHLVFSGGEQATATFLKRIGRSTDPRSFSLSGDGELVRDVRFVMTIEPESAATFTLAWQTEEDRTAVFTLTPPSAETGSTVSTVRADGEPMVSELDGRLRPGRRTEVELEYVDGQVYAHVDGVEVAHLDEARVLGDVRAIGDFEQELRLTAEGGRVVVKDVRIERDVHYGAKSMYDLARSGDGVYVPEGHYFMMGDNTDHSSDSRAWELSGVILEDGTEIWYEADNSDNRPRLDEDGCFHVIDRAGIERRWRREDENHRDTERVPFVARDLIVGRAFFIFWPIFPDLPGRAGFIH